MRSGTRKGGGAARSRRDKSRRAVYAGSLAEIDDRTEAERAFEPVFADFRVPGSVSAAFEAFASSPETACGRGLALGRVVRLDRGYPLVVTEHASLRAEHAVSLVKGECVRAAVGDWVAVGLPDGHDKALIERIFERVGELSRWDGGNRGERQVLAANVDVLLAVQPLSKKLVSPDRLVRSAVLAYQGGMRPAAVLTKADRCAEEEGVLASLEAVRGALGPDVPVVAVSCARGRGVEEVRALVPEGTSALVLGESGAGKSTLINALLGCELLGTGEVRERDDRGRHTTVARRMLKVPGGGVLVDAPGLRSLPLLDENYGLERAFPEIAARVPACRFRDCTHGDEPGCAVRAGVSEGDVDPARLEEYRLLCAEMLSNRRGLALSAKASITQ